MSEKKYRLVTRSDFDGLVCAALLRELGLIDDIEFVHPKDMQDGKVTITGRDITTNLPYVQSCHLSFDHHSSEVDRIGYTPDNLIIDPKAPSAAAVVYNYYGGKERFPHLSASLMDAVNRADSAQYTRDEVLTPDGWVMLNYIMDQRTGLGRFHHFRVSNRQLMRDIIDPLRNQTAAQILAMPDIKERVDLYLEQSEKFKEQLKRCSKVYKNLIVLDLREDEVQYVGNRFMIYALYPECNISIHVMWGLKKMNTVFAVGKSILNRSSRTNVGNLCLKYGGGGHVAAGTCQVDNARAAQALQELIDQINADG